MLPLANLPGQTHYVNEASGERSFAFPGSQPAAVTERARYGGPSHDERGKAASSARGRCEPPSARWVCVGSGFVVDVGVCVVEVGVSVFMLMLMLLVLMCVLVDVWLMFRWC